MKAIHRETLMVIAAYISANGCAPSTRDLAALLGVASTSAIHNRLDRLEASGYIERTPSVWRSMRLTRKGKLYVGRYRRERA